VPHTLIFTHQWWYGEEDQDEGGCYNIKIDLREIGWDGTECIDVAQDRDQWRAVVNTVMNLRVP
jgi:hypothetical protein